MLETTAAAATAAAELRFDLPNGERGRNRPKSLDGLSALSLRFFLLPDDDDVVSFSWSELGTVRSWVD